MHESFNEFKFRPDTTTNIRAICPCMSEKLMFNVAPTFLIGSSSFFQILRTTLKSGQSSNLRQIGPRAAELAALDRIEKLKNSIDL